MAVFKDAGENANIFQQRDNLLDEASLKKYEEKFGIDRAIGYMEAMRDFNHQLKHILGAGYLYAGVPKAGMKMRNQIKALFHDNDDLIEHFINKHKSIDEQPSI